ncbi:outer membrane lipoprotein-sorting protein [Rhodocaloribacter sp.]
MTPRRLAKAGGLVLAALLCAARPVAAQTADTLSAKEIVRRADDLLRGKTQQGKYRMTIIRPDWQRTTEFAFWSEGTEKSFIRVLNPPKDRGVAFLKIGRQMWQYIPRINRVIKIPPSMMLESWMGSDFTNDDLVKESSIVEDYTHRLLGRETFGEDEAYKIELIPKPDAPVTWSRIVEWIRVSDFIPLRAEYFNERDEHIRTLLFSDVRTFGNRTLPARMELVEETKPGHETILLLEEAVFDRPIPPSIFSQQNLRRRM